MTISEALYFGFNGRHSSEFGIINVHTNSGMFEESFLPSRSIIEEKIPYRNEPYFYGLEYDVKEIPVTFAFLEPFNDKLIEDIMNWLYVETYKPFYFSTDENRIWYAMVVSDSTITHAGLKEGYVKLTLRCNSPFAYTNVYTLDYHLTNNANGKEITLNNIGNVRIRPNIHFKKVGNGNISITNLNDRGKTMTITNLVDEEEIFIDGDNEELETSLLGGYRYDDFNFQYIELVRGLNRLIIKGDGYFQITYQCKRF